MMRSFENLPVAEKHRPALAVSKVLDVFGAVTSCLTVREANVGWLNVLRWAG